MPNIISNRNRSPKHYPVCSIYSDTTALRDAKKQIKSLRRGKSVNIDMMSKKALEELLYSYSSKKYEINGVSISENDDFYEVTVHRYNLIEKLINTLTSMFSHSNTRTNTRSMKCFSGAEDYDW